MPSDGPFEVWRSSDVVFAGPGVPVVLNLTLQVSPKPTQYSCVLALSNGGVKELGDVKNNMEVVIS